MDESKLRDEIERGYEAQLLLDNPLLKDAKQAIREKILEMIAKSPIRGESSSREQQQLIMLLQMNDRFSRVFDEYVTTGHLAERQLRDSKITDLFRRAG